MEITSDLASDGETVEVSPSESPPEEFSETPPEEWRNPDPPQNAEDFNRRVENLMLMMADDPSVRDRILAEIYVNIGSAEMGIRGVFEMIQTQGIGGFMRGAFKRG